MALSGSFTGKTSNKYITPKIEWSATQDITKNISTVTATLRYSRNNTGYKTYGDWSGSITINGKKVNGSKNNIQLTYNSNTFAMSATVPVEHNADGSKSITISASGKIGGTSLESTSISDTITLDKIPRQAIITGAANFNDTQKPYLKYSNPAGNVVESLQACISLTGDKDDIKYRNISKTGTEYYFTLTDDEYNVLRNATTTSNSRTIYYYVRTVIAGVTYYSKLAKTLNIVNCMPTISVELVDKNSKTAAIAGGGTFVKGQSIVGYTITATALKGATIKSYKAVNGLITKSTATGEFNPATSNPYVFTVTDSRGNTATQTLEPYVYDYIRLTCRITDKYLSPDGVLTATMTGNWYNGQFLMSSNSLSTYYRIKEDGGSYGSWQLVTPRDSENTHTETVTISGLDYRKTYIIQTRAKDKLMDVYSSEEMVSGLPVFDWSKEDFNFNVPVTMTVDEVKYPLMSIVKAMTKGYACDATITPAENYTDCSVSATLWGNNLRCYVKATRTAASGAGNISNEKVATVNIIHDGKIEDYYTVSFGNGVNGSLASFYLDNATNVSDTEIQFDICMAATGSALTYISTGFCLPVSINLDKY